MPRLTPQRLIPWFLFLALTSATVLTPSNVPVWLFWALAGSSSGLFVFLIGDRLLDLYVKRMRGSDSSPGSFIGSEALTLISAGLFALGLSCVLFALRVPMSSGPQLGFLAGGGGAAALSALGLLIRMIPWRAKRERRNPLSEILERINPPTLLSDLQEAWEFQKICGGRLTRPLLALWFVGLLLGAAGFAALVLPQFLMISDPTQLLDVDNSPLLAKILFFFSVGYFSILTTTFILATFRVVTRMRRIGRLRKREIWKELGLSLEKSGIAGNFGYGLVTLLLQAIFLYAALTVANTLQEEGFPAPLAITAAAFIWGAVTFVVMLWPQIYLFPIMARRDCGWMTGFDASATLVSMEKGDSFLRGLLALGLILLVLPLPAGVTVLLLAAESRTLVLAAVLGEKTRKEVDEALDERVGARSNHLKKYFDLLEEGRYLDALNGFQMRLMKDREDVQAMEGQSLAYLKMGNPNARESLERWAMLNPEDPRPMDILEELAEGRWSEGGDLLKKAQNECTQQIGRGV